MTLKVYAIEDSTRNLVKIGISKQPAERCKQIALIACSIGYEPNFVLLGSAPIEFGSFERLIHLSLGDARHKNEWFLRDDPNVDDFIRSVIVLNGNGRHLMRPATWLYRRRMLPEAWKPSDIETNQELATRRMREHLQRTWAAEAAEKRVEVNRRQWRRASIRAHFRDGLVDRIHILRRLSTAAAC